MSPPLQPVFFDVDGVLVDSLPQHLRICEDKAREFGLDLRIPDVAGFRRSVSQGLKISPMKAFFLAVGFPELLAERAVADYEREFMQRYRPAMFAGVPELLQGLRSAGLRLGLVTSNTRGNVEPALGASLAQFEPGCRFFYDRETAPEGKSWWLTEGARRLGVPTGECIYIGDQPGDAAAAREAGFRFLGVTYGWGIEAGDTRYPLADSVEAIAQKLRHAPASIC